jgi:hypothetical protein
MADKLTLTIRLHDPKEKKDHKQSASWVVAQIDRDHLSMETQQFFDYYIKHMLPQLTNAKFNA